MLEKVDDLRYGENPHQRAAFYRETTHRSGTLADATRLQGDMPSFNNLLDLDAAYRIARDYTAPTVAIVKHTDPVGLASHDELVEAYRHALETDPVAAFGGIVGVNRELDGATAREIAANSYEAVVAPGFSQSAIGILRGKPGLELLAIPPDPTEGMRDYGIASLDFKRVAGGLLVESLDELGLDRGRLQVVTKRRPTLEELTDLLFAWRAVRHVRSNAIVLARNGATVGIGAGQASRQVSVEIAVRRAGDRARLSVLASDAYFPFPDGIQAAAGAGVTAIIQPGGSIRDEMAIEVADRHHLADGLHRVVRSFPSLRLASRLQPRDLSALAPMEQLLALEMIRVTEAAAIESARFMGRGQKDEADAAATEAMRRTMDEIDFAGRIVIGEGERDEAPMLYIGEKVGRTGADRDDVPRVDIAVDPLEGTNLVAHGQAGAITVLAASEAGGLTHAPDTYMEKLCVGPVAAGKVDIRESPTENLGRIAAGARPAGQRHHRGHPRARRATTRSSPRSAQAGARIKLIGDGDLSAAISCAVSGTGVHAVMGIGGAPEGVITAAALRCLGGEIQARFRYRSDDERERGARMGHGDEIARLHDRGPGPRREPGLRRDRGDRRRPPPGRPLLRWRRADPFAGDGLPGQAGPLRRHRPHVRPRQPAARPALGATDRALRLQGLGRAVPAPAPARPRDRRGAGRLRFGLDQRPLPAVAAHRRPRPERPRLARRGRPGDRAGHARHAAS